MIKKGEPVRYKFYREHKYVSAAVNGMERMIAQADFRVDEEGAFIKKAFEGLANMLTGHASYENNRLHKLLKDKGSTVYKNIEEDHEHYQKELQGLYNLLNATLAAQSPEERLELGYHFYLQFRRFAGENLLHLHQEETIILPELQKLYDDDFLSKVEWEAYTIMTPEQMLEMIQVIFPHMNPSDREAFLTDIKACSPEKFDHVWQAIKDRLPEKEQKALIATLSIA